MRTMGKIAVLVPVCDDWESAEMLLAGLREALRDKVESARVFLIDDASSQPRPECFARTHTGDGFSVDVVTLKRNLGHQRALPSFCPAHQGLFSPFDAAIGHFRRYSRRTLAAAAPASGLRRERLFYLDSIGMLASLANRLFLKSAMPTPGQIRFWDSRLVRCSRWLDPLLFRRVGKSVVGVWRRV